MYDEIVKCLRICTSDKRGYGCGSECIYGKKHPLNYWCVDYLLKDAADAIEELQQIVEQMKAEIIVEAQHTEMYDDRDKRTLIEMAKSLPLQIIPHKEKTPRWIPVTERLPEKGETYGDITFSVEVLGTEGYTYRKAYYNFKAKVWLDGNEEQEWPEITHWMPLPEPPKEE